MSAAVLALLVAAAEASPAEAPRAPESHVVMRRLIEAAATPLPDDVATGCASLGNLGEYLSLLVAYGGVADPGHEQSLTLACVSGHDGMEMLPDQRVTDGSRFWSCTLDAHWGDGKESGWDYELRFLISKETGELDRTRFWCPGLP